MFFFGLLCPWHFWSVLDGYFVPLSLDLSLSDASSLLDSGYTLLAGVSPKWHCVLLSVSRWDGRDVTGHVNTDHLVKVVFTRLLHYKVIFFPFVISKCLVGSYLKITLTPHSSKNSQLILSSLDDSCLNKTLQLPPNFSFFSNFIIASTFIAWLSIERKCFPIFSFMYLFLSTGSMDFQFTQWVTIHYIDIYFDVQTVPYLASGSNFKLIPVWFWQIPLTFWDFLTLWNKKIFQAYRVLCLCPSFLQRALISVCGEWDLETKTWALGILIASKPSPWTELRTVCILMPMDILISVSISVYVRIVKIMSSHQ